MGKESENNNLLNLLQIDMSSNKDPEEEKGIPMKGHFNVFCDIEEERWR